MAAYVASVAGKPGAAKPPSGGQTTGGKEIFTANCGGCHTLADAGTTGTVGPNLDQAKPPKSLVVHAGDERQVADAALQGRADRRGDPGRRGLRLFGRRKVAQRGNRVGLQADFVCLLGLPEESVLACSPCRTRCRVDAHRNDGGCGRTRVDGLHRHGRLHDEPGG